MLSRIVGGLSEGNVQLAMYVAVAFIFSAIANHKISTLKVPFFQMFLHLQPDPEHSLMSVSHLPYAFALAHPSAPISLLDLSPSR